LISLSWLFIFFWIALIYLDCLDCKLCSDLVSDFNFEIALSSFLTAPSVLASFFCVLLIYLSWSLFAAVFFFYCAEILAYLAYSALITLSKFEILPFRAFCTILILDLTVLKSFFSWDDEFFRFFERLSIYFFWLLSYIWSFLIDPWSCPICFRVAFSLFYIDFNNFDYDEICLFIDLIVF